MCIYIYIFSYLVIYSFICSFIYLFVFVFTSLFLFLFLSLSLSLSLSIYIYIYGHPPPPPKIYTCRLHTITCLFSHMCTLIISAETIVNIGVFRCCPRMHTTLLLSILFRYIDKSAADFRSTNITLYVFGKQNLSEGTRVICCGTQKTSCFLHFSVLRKQ